MRSAFVVFLLASASASFDGQYREEGDSCGPSNQSMCRKLADCSSALDAMEEGKDPDTCSVTSRGVTIVCCPPELKVRSGADPTLSPKPQSRGGIAKKMCKKYSEGVIQRKPFLDNGRVKFVDVDECGVKEEPLIVQGINASLKEFPHMAEIGYIRNNYVAWNCGGSLISDRWVLSAAHCTTLRDNFGNAVLVRLGDLDITTKHDGAFPEIYEITERKNHPDWNGVHAYNDIALYKLNATVKLNSFIRPICLQVEERADILSGLATGWGHTSWVEGVGSPRLMKAWIKLFRMEDCKKFYGTGYKLPRGILEDRMLCAGGEGKTDTCQGDSGGPLQIATVDPYCMYSQFAVTSFGVECGSNYPAVYTKVSYYVPWIESVVWPDERI